MKKLDARDPETASRDLIADNLHQLKALFPEAWTEGKIDFDVLKQLLGGAVDEREEKYGLNWHGKRQARAGAQTPSMGTLRPSPDESMDWDTTQNVVIEGDNLEVLKLLEKSYAGRVKMIYIDPPYNTGNDFVYADDFRDGVANYLQLTQQFAGETKLRSNPDSSGRFHTAWLNMMYPRLKIAHSLLRQDGAMFVSCDEAEQPRLRLLMDDLFGQENFVADMIWAAGRKNDSRLVSVSHEYIVCYAFDAGYLADTKVEWRQRKKGIDEIYAEYARLRRLHGADYAAMTAGLKEWFRNLPPSSPSRAHKHYSRIDAKGVYFPADISWPGGGGPKYEVLHPQTKRPVRVPARGWITPDPEKMARWIAEDRVQFGADESSVPCLKAYLKDQEYQAPYSVFYQDGRAATKRLRDLMGADCFNFPKDETVLQDLIGMMTSGSDIILDCFAGSGTTGHAVMAQNALDGGSRRSILVQLPEPLSPDDDKQRAAAEFCDLIEKPRNLAELTKERLRRAARKISDGHPKSSLDLGFRVFRLDATNLRTWNPSPEDIGLALLESVEHVTEDRTEDDVLYELILKLGRDLCAPIATRVIAGATVWCVDNGAIFACLAASIPRADISTIADSIAAWHAELAPGRETTIVFRDSAFANDATKANVTALLAQHGLPEVRSL